MRNPEERAAFERRLAEKSREAKQQDAAQSEYRQVQKGRQNSGIASPSSKRRGKATTKNGSKDALAEAKQPVNRRISSLQEELATSRECLQSIIQDLESANEELQSANAEVWSANEQLQSTNEDLDAAKEELQSTSEELNTVNEELHGRNEELSRVNSDLVNLLRSVQIPIVIVASDLCIRRFTPAAERVLNLIPSDIGRPISHITPNIDCPDLESLISHVVDTVAPTERHVRDQHGDLFSLRIRPYKNVENRIEGAVLALFPVSLTESGESVRSLAASVSEAVYEPVALLDAELRVIHLNHAFSNVFGVRSADAAHRSLLSLQDGHWNHDALRALLRQQLTSGTSGDSVEITYPFRDGGPQRIHAAVRRLAGTTGADTILIFTPRRARQRPQEQSVS